MLLLENYKTVSASSTDQTTTYTPASGETIYVTCLSGDAAVSNDVKVEIDWDGNPIFTTHNSNTQLAPDGSYLTKLEGNGTKVLKIKLVNNSSQSETIGGRVVGSIKYG